MGGSIGGGGGSKNALQNVAIGAGLQVFEVSTLGQPFEVVKTHMAGISIVYAPYSLFLVANRSDNLLTAIRKSYQRGGLAGFYQGLIPWAWIEASTKGAVLLFASSEVEKQVKARFGYGPNAAGAIGGMIGGIAQAYTTMGFCTFMKTVEVTRHKQAGASVSTIQVAKDVLKREGIAGLNKGVTAVAVRQMTNWGSRFGISRVTEGIFRGNDKNRKLSVYEKLMASTVGGALGCWNQPIEVIRVEMQSQTKSANRPEKLNIWTTAKYIYQNNGMRGFYRGVTPRIGLGIYQTVCMVFGGDQIKERFGVK